MSPGAIWAEVEPGFHIELETAIWVDVLPDKRRDGAQVRRRQPLIWEHVNPYGRFDLDMNARLALL